MLKTKESEPAEPGDTPPGEVVAVIARPVDGERFRRGVAGVDLGVATQLARRGVSRGGSRAFDLPRHDRGTRYAGRWIARAGGGRGRVGGSGWRRRILCEPADGRTGEQG